MEWTETAFYFLLGLFRAVVLLGLGVVAFEVLKLWWRHRGEPIPWILLWLVLFVIFSGAYRQINCYDSNSSYVFPLCQAVPIRP